MTPHLDYSDRGKTVSLMLCLTKIIHGPGKIVVLNSLFCVLQELADIKIRESTEPLLSRRGIIDCAILMITKSRITSPKRQWGPCMHYAVIFTMSLFVSLLWNRKTMPWWTRPPTGQMGGWVIKKQKDWWGTDQLRVPQYYAQPIPEQRHSGLAQCKAPSNYLNWGDMVHKAFGETVFLTFCWLYQRSTLILGSTNLLTWRSVGQCWISGESFRGTPLKKPNSGKMRAYQKHARTRQTSTLMDTFSPSYGFIRWRTRKFRTTKKNRYKKNAKKKRHKKSKRSNIKYFLTIYFLTETTQKCTNFVDTLFVLHFLNYHLLIFRISIVHWLNYRNLKDVYGLHIFFRSSEEDV